jgi:hypothetical protein
MSLFKDFLKILFLGYDYFEKEKITPELLFEAKRKFSSPEAYEKVIRKKIFAYEKMIRGYQERNLEVPKTCSDNLQVFKNALAEIER